MSAPAASSASAAAARLPSPSASPPPALPRRPGLWRSTPAGPHWISKDPPLALERGVQLSSAADELQLAYLADRRDLIPAVAAALWAEWGAENFAATDSMPSVVEVQQWVEEECCETVRLGCTIVALVNGELVGCAMLAPEDTPTDHPYWGTVPWASYNVILPAYRGRGYSKLVWRRLTALAREWGYGHCWAVAEGALVGMYQKLGWKIIEADIDFWGEPATVLRIDFERNQDGEAEKK